MNLSSPNLAALRVGFNAAFRGGYDSAPPTMWPRVASLVNSTRGSERYGWLNKIPGLRKWVGPRLLRNISESDYTIVNENFEETVTVDTNDVDDDALGIYATLFSALGAAVAVHPDQLVYALLKAGFATNCFDGQSFFDTDHAYIDENGAPVTWANTDGGAGTPWFLLYTKGPVKPLIYQERKKPMLVSKDRPDDDNVFFNRNLVYGVDKRCAVGFGFPHMAWGSKQALSAANYAIARAAMMGFKGDGGLPLGVVPDLLVVPPALESDGRKIVNSEYGTGGVTNEWKGTAELLVAPWLA